jgi:arylsulfatase A-like enzyme
MGRFYKACLQDGSVKVPFIWRVPGLVGAGDSHQRTQLAGLQDILPTLASLANVKLPSGVQGMDLRAQIRDANAPGREYYVTETQSDGRKYMVRTARWKYNYYVMGGGEELYDMSTPEGEMRDLTGEASCAGLLGEMRGRLIEWAGQTAAADLVQQGRLVVTPVTQRETKFNDSIMGWRWY